MLAWETSEWCQIKRRPMQQWVGKAAWLFLQHVSPAQAKYHQKCCSFSKVPWRAWAWESISRTVVSLQTLISQEGGRGWGGWLGTLEFATGRIKATHSSIVLSCGCSYCANLPPSEPHPNAVLPSPGAGGLGAGAMGDFRKDSWDFSLLQVRPLLLSHHWEWWWTFLMGFCWLIVLISRIPHFWSALKGQGKLQHFRWSARKASQSHLLQLLFHCQNLCYGHLAPVCRVELNRDYSHQQRLGPLCWKIPAFQDTLILLQLFYFVCSEAGQVIWHWWARLLKAFINVRSFIAAEDPAPPPLRTALSLQWRQAANSADSSAFWAQKEVNLPCLLS